MNNERKQVLDMLAEGKITADEADSLLDKLNTGSETEISNPVESSKSRKLKYLRVLVESADGENVNVRVPLALVKAGIKLKAVIPKNAQEKMDEKGVNLDALNELDEDELMEALRDLQVDVDSDKGDTVRIFCE
jgi:hypothetical protein